MMTKMCRNCLDSYGWGDRAPAFRVFGEACHCCLNKCTTVFMMSGEMIDRLNKEDAENEKRG